MHVIAVYLYSKTQDAKARPALFFRLLEVCHLRCALAGVSFSMLSLRRFVCQKHDLKSAEGVIHIIRRCFVRAWDVKALPAIHRVSATVTLRKSCMAEVCAVGSSQCCDS